MGLIGAALAAVPAVAFAQPVDLFYERTVMSALGDRCRLFGVIGWALPPAMMHA